MKTISILGAGWLGFPLAETLKKEGYTVKATTTTPAKMGAFAVKGLEPFLVSDAHFVEEELHDFFSGTDVLLITIPPNRAAEGNDYVKNIAKFLPYVEQHDIKEVLFTGSTTVYLSLSGLVNEDTPVTPVAEMDRQIMEIEDLLLKNPAFNATVLRLGGLIGEDRHPVTFMALRPEIAEANEPVNMVHRDDIIRFVQKLVKKRLPNAVFNVVAPVLDDKRMFYTKAAKEFKVALPAFAESAAPKMRRVDGTRIVKYTGIDYSRLVNEKTDS